MNRIDTSVDGDRQILVNDTDDSGENSSDARKRQQNGYHHVPSPRENVITQRNNGLVLNSSRVSDGRETDTNTYTELLRGSVPCPTCRGNGSIPKEQEGQLVALIPLKDKRLKPRRTYLYVCLAVFLCLTAAGLLLFFMFPRNVTIESNKPFLSPQNLSIAVQSVQFLISNPINITNQNYFPVTVNSITMSVLFRTKVVTTSNDKNTTTVPIRDTVSTSVTAQLKFNELNEFGYMAILCNDTNTWFHEFVMVFDFTVSYSYLGHDEMTSLTTYQSVSCGNDTAPVISTHKPQPLTTTKVTTTEVTTSEVTTKGGST
ncbi:transmembrane protein 106B-like [Mizuhopecten yessoensis]|uniref:Transmembrane protein 106B n=1 Tax=Mizuhopecten yessoensis TaxID=6573 RepID=A0A210PS78_MIZYE|nr:transmembrane protein 106B-like [Mizuhopecten yessoensis]OWF39349.1 Transmembrane protein 106B [Mizuhopecten yessoensis]